MGNTQSLLDLDFSRTEILAMSFIPAIINLIIFGYILFFQPNNRLNVTFALFCLVVSMWQFTDSFMRLAYDQQTAMDWYYIMGVFALMVTPIGVVFIINYAKWEKIFSAKFLVLTQLVPPIFLICMNTARPDIHAIVPSEKWHWIANPNQSLTTQIVYSWVSLQGLFILALLGVNYYNNRFEKQKKFQALMLAIGFSIPVIGGIISQAIIPLWLGMDNIPITPVLFTFFSIFTLISILKYNFLEYSPKHHWDTIIETMKEGLIIVNLENKIMFVNSQFMSLTGYMESELIGFRADLDFMKKQDFSIQFNEETYEKQILNKEGERIWVLISVTPYLDDKNRCIGLIAIYTDINDQKRSEARFKALVENAGDIIVMSDRHSRITYVSPAIEKVFGYTLNDLKESSILELIHPEDLENAMDNYSYILENPSSLSKSATRFVHKNGEPVWVEGVIVNLLEDENVQAIVYNYKDIRERKLHENKIQNFIEVTTDQNQRLQNFAHIVSHNIRSHVVNISGLIDILNQTQEEKERLQLIQMLKTSSDKLTETTDNLNEIVTIQNNINNELKELNLKNEIIKTESVINSLTKKHNCQINNKVASDVHVKAIPSYLESILLNLLTNAVKYRSGDRTLQIDITSEKSPMYHILSVQDNGIGIDLDKHGDKMFGMYKTFHSNKDSKGLGLFITKTHIEAMNGKIMVESKPNQGTKFMVYFPN